MGLKLDWYTAERILFSTPRICPMDWVTSALKDPWLSDDSFDGIPKRQIQLQRMMVDVSSDTIQKAPDRVCLIAHFSACRSPRVMRIALSDSHRLAGSSCTKPLAPPCAPNHRRDINNSRPGRAPERLYLVRSRKRSQTLFKEWKYVLVCHMTPPSRRICPLGPYISNLIFWIVLFISRVARWGRRLLDPRPTRGRRA